MSKHSSTQQTKQTAPHYSEFICPNHWNLHWWSCDYSWELYQRFSHPHSLSLHSVSCSYFVKVSGINTSSPAISSLVSFVMQISDSGCASVCTQSFLSLFWHFCEATSGPSHWTYFDFSGEAALFLLGWCCHRHKTCMQCYSYSMKALHLSSPQVLSDWKRGLVDTAPIFILFFSESVE